MSEIMKLSFEQAKWAVFGWSWDNIEVKFAVVVSVGSIFWWLYKVTQNTHLKSLIQKLNRLVFSDIMEHSLPEFYSADERVKQNLEKLIAESDEGKVNGTLPTLDLDPLLVSFPEYIDKTECLIADLQHFIRVYNGINRLAPLRITMMFDDEAKMLLTMLCSFRMDYKERRSSYNFFVDHCHKTGTYDKNKIFTEIRDFRNNNAHYFNNLRPTLNILMHKIELTLESKATSKSALRFIKSMYNMFVVKTSQRLHK